MFLICVDKEDILLVDTSETNRSESRASSRSSGRTSKRSKRRGFRRQPKIREEMSAIEEQSAKSSATSVRWVLVIMINDLKTLRINDK